MNSFINHALELKVKTCMKTCQVKLGEEGWKERYYSNKFMADTLEKVVEVRKSVVRVISKASVLFFFSTVDNIFMS